MVLTILLLINVPEIGYKTKVAYSQIKFFGMTLMLRRTIYTVCFIVYLVALESLIQLLAAFLILSSTSFQESIIQAFVISALMFAPRWGSKLQF